MLSYNTVHKRGVIHTFIYFAKSHPQNTCSKQQNTNYTKHKEIYILSHSTQTSHVTEWRLKKSAPTFSDPLIAQRVNWYCWRTKAQRMRRPFCPYWTFPKYNKGWWSVSKINSFPQREFWNFCMALFMAHCVGRLFFLDS